LTKKPNKTLSRGEAGGQAVTFTLVKRGFVSPAMIGMSAGRTVTAPNVITACREVKAKMRADALRGTLSLCTRSGTRN